MNQVIIGREFPQVLTPLIEQAQHSIEILVFDWRWYKNEPNSNIQKFNSAILEASARGVKVRALVNNNIMPTILQLEKLSVKRVGTKKMMHVKMIIIDKKLISIGSHNFSKNAFEFNHEVSTLSDDENIILRCTKYFNNLCLL
ncbi:MAG: phospholipase D/transphosphatidylase [uncultured bacterium]|nr:MAG: phospholipase D/transphosphatidylase [uncultured bacterium]